MMQKIQFRPRFQFHALVRSFVADGRGATAIEYALIAGMISIVILGAVTLLGQSTLGLFTTTATAMQ